LVVSTRELQNGTNGQVWPNDGQRIQVT
jgi:hypothetical protein